MPRRHDVLDHWLQRRQITDWQANAGRRFRDLYDVAGLQGHATVDLAGPSVSLHGRADGPAAARTVAQSEMMAIRPILGAVDFALVCRIVGAGEDIGGATVSGGGRKIADPHAATESERRYISHRVRDALGVLAVRFALHGA